MLKANNLPSTEESLESALHIKMPVLNRKLAILLLSLPFIPSIVNQKSAFAKEEPSASQPGKVLRNPNEKLELPTHSQMALEEALRRDPVLRRAAVDILQKGRSLQGSHPYGDIDESTREEVRKSFKTTREAAGWYDVYEGQHKNYIKALETRDSYKSHSLLPAFIGGAIDLASVRAGKAGEIGADIAKEIINKELEHAGPQEVIDARKTLFVDMSIPDQARLIIDEYSKGGWTSELVDGTKLFEEMGFDFRDTPQQIENKFPGVATRVTARQELIERRNEINGLNEKVAKLEESYRKGNSSVIKELKKAKKDLENKIDEANHYTQEIIVTSLDELQSGVNELLAWKADLEARALAENQRIKAQTKIENYYAVVGALTDALSLVDPKVANIVGGLGNVVGSIMSASASGFAFGPVVGVISSVIGFFGSLFSQPDTSLYDYLDKRFERIENMLENLYKQLSARIDVLDQKLSVLIDYAKDNRDFQFEHRQHLEEIGFQTKRNSTLLDEVVKRLDEKAQEDFETNLETSLREFTNAVKNGFDPHAVKVDREGWLDEYLMLGTQLAEERLFVGAISDAKGYCDREIRHRGVLNSEGIVSAFVAKIAKTKQSLFELPKARNGIALAEAVLAAVQVPENWPQGTVRLSQSHAEELKKLIDERLKFYQDLTSEQVVALLANAYSDAVVNLILKLATTVDSSEFRLVAEIPTGISLRNGLDQFASPVFQSNGKLNPERKPEAVDIQYDTLRKFLTYLMRQELGGEIEFPGISKDERLKIELSPDVFNFNSEHIIRTLMGTMLPSGSQNSAQVNSVNQYRVANYGTFLLSSPKVVTGEKAWVVKVKTGVDMVSSGKGAEHDRAVPIYEEAKYEILELNSRITFQILVSALEDSMRLPIREISQIEFTPDRAYPIVTWHSHKSGPQASNVPATEINDEFYKQLFGDWNVHYNKMATVGSEFALRIIQLLLDREKPMTLKGELTSRVINFGKDAIDESDITDIALQVDKNGYHRILVTVAGEGTFVVERSHAEQVLRQAIAANKLDSKYLNTDSYLPMNLMSGDLHGFNLKLSVSGVDSKLQIQSAEKRYLNLERNSAEKLLEYREGLRGLYQSMLELDDISTVMRAVLGLSVPDEILGSIDLLNAVRSDKGLLTSDFIVARLEDIKSGRMTFKEFFQLIDEQGKESARGFVDGLAKLRASDPKYGASRFRQAKEALDAYLKSLEGN